MLETQTPGKERFVSINKQIDGYEGDGMNIPDVCQHESHLSKHKSISLESKISSEDSSDVSMRSCAPSDDDCSHLLASEERINQVTSQALLARRNSLRLVARSPKLSRRSTPIAELDRKWALNQCEELTTWVNSLLARKETTLETDLKKSMSDGHTLPILVSVLSSDFEVSSAPAKNRQEQFERTRVCLDHLKELGYCTEVSAQEIVNGDLKSVILLLSGLKNFYEQLPASDAEDMKPSITPRQTANTPTVNGSTNEFMQGKAGKEASVSERLRRILKEPHTPGINVDSGERDTSTIREQPVGESDSAASPTSHHGDHFHNYYGSQKGQPRQQQGQPFQRQRNQQQPIVSQPPQQLFQSADQQQLPQRVALQRQQDRYQRTDSNHQQAQLSAPQTLPNSRRNHGPNLYNNSVPNLHSSPVDRGVVQPPRSMTPTPNSNKLSVYPGNVVRRPSAMSPPHNLQMEMYPATVQQSSRTPHSQWREIQPSPPQRVYETIDEVKGQQANLPEYILRGVERGNPNSQQLNSDDQSNPGVAIAPDAQYETSARRASMPSAYHQTNSHYKAVNKRSDMQLEEGTDSEDNYVDVSDDDEETSNGEANLNGSATPPLPELDNDMASLEQHAYKYQRSLSAGPKLLSAGLRSFQRKMVSANEGVQQNVVEEETEDDEEADKAKEIQRINKPEKSGRETPQPVSYPEVQYRRPSHQRSSNKETRRGRRQSPDCEEMKYNRDIDSHLDLKVHRLERLYDDMSNYLHSSKQSRHRDSRRHSIASASSSQYSYSHRHRKSRSPSDAKVTQKRFHRLEAHIVTLAKSVAHLSTKVSTQNSIFNEMDRISNELEMVKKRLPSGSLDIPSEPSHSNEQGEANPQKLSKLTRLKSSIRRRFFGQEPPLMRLFLKQLGYEKYEPLFAAEKIGVLELSYMSEERLRTIGIPLGPRVRILQEATRLCLSSQTPTNTGATGSRTKNNNR